LFAHALSLLDPAPPRARVGQGTIALILLGAVLLVVLVFRALRGPEPVEPGEEEQPVRAPRARRPSPREAEYEHLLEALEARLARGEISEGEYAAHKEALAERFERGEPLSR